MNMILDQTESAVVLIRGCSMLMRTGVLCECTHYAGAQCAVPGCGCTSGMRTANSQVCQWACGFWSVALVVVRWLGVGGAQYVAARHNALMHALNGNTMVPLVEGASVLSTAAGNPPFTLPARVVAPDHNPREALLDFGFETRLSTVAGAQHAFDAPAEFRQAEITSCRYGGKLAQYNAAVAHLAAFQNVQGATGTAGAQARSLLALDATAPGMYDAATDAYRRQSSLFASANHKQVATLSGMIDQASLERCELAAACYWFGQIRMLHLLLWHSDQAPDLRRCMFGGERNGGAGTFHLAGGGGEARGFWIPGVRVTTVDQLLVGAHDLPDVLLDATHEGIGAPELNLICAALTAGSHRQDGCGAHHLTVLSNTITQAQLQTADTDIMHRSWPTLRHAYAWLVSAVPPAMQEVCHAWAWLGASSIVRHRCGSRLLHNAAHCVKRFATGPNHGLIVPGSYITDRDPALFARDTPEAALFGSAGCFDYLVNQAIVGAVAGANPAERFYYQPAAAAVHGRRAPTAAERRTATRYGLAINDSEYDDDLRYVICQCLNSPGGGHVVTALFSAVVGPTAAPILARALMRGSLLARARPKALAAGAGVVDRAWGFNPWFAASAGIPLGGTESFFGNGCAWYDDDVQGNGDIPYDKDGLRLAQLRPFAAPPVAAGGPLVAPAASNITLSVERIDAGFRRNKDQWMSVEVFGADDVCHTVEWYSGAEDATARLGETGYCLWWAAGIMSPVVTQPAKGPVLHGATIQVAALRPLHRLHLLADKSRIHAVMAGSGSLARLVRDFREALRTLGGKSARAAGPVPAEEEERLLKEAGVREDGAGAGVV